MNKRENLLKFALGLGVVCLIVSSIARHFQEEPGIIEKVTLSKRITHDEDKQMGTLENNQKEQIYKEIDLKATIRG